MKKLFLFVVAIGLLQVNFIVAQSWQDGVVNSGTQIQKGLQLHDEGNYKGAIEKYNSILEGDTNYVLSLYEKSLSELKDKNYVECIKSCKKGLYLDSFYHYFYITLAAAHAANKEFAKSNEILDLAISKFPENYLFLFNKASNFQDENKFDEAIEHYYKALEKNPFHVGSHIRLAVLSNDCGKQTQSTFHLLLALITTPSSDVTGAIVDLLSNTLIAKKTEQIKNYTFLGNKGDDFSEIDELIASQVALNKKYKLLSSLDYNIVRQIQLILYALEKHQGKNGFYEKNYLPLFKSIVDNNLFEPFTYFIFKNLDNNQVQTLIQKNSKKVETFSNWLKNDFYNKVSKAKDGRDRIFYNAPYHLQGIGTIKNGTLEGLWTFYYESGTKLSEGNFKADKKTGVWKWYYENGKLKKEMTFVDGVPNGKFFIYYENGVKRKESNFKNELEDGEAKIYYEQGGIKEILTLKNDDFNGESKTYYANGELESIYNFKNNLKDGKFIRYYPNKQLMFESNYKNGLIDGKYISYHMNGKVDFTANYTNDQLNGEFKKYYSDGTLRYEGKAVNGNYVGLYKEYYPNGKLETEIQYDEQGKENGIEKVYNIDGSLYYETTYTKGEQTNIKYYNTKGKMIHEIAIKNNTDVQTFYPTGEKYAVGKFVKGKKTGEWKRFYRNGLPYEVENYKNGKDDGIYQLFYKNGQLKYSLTYENGYQNGYYKRYYSNKALQEEGRILMDEKVGTWKTYNQNGGIDEECFYVNGKLNGPLKEYDILGKLYSISYYDMDELRKHVIFDTMGKIAYTFDVSAIPQTHNEVRPDRLNTIFAQYRTYINGELNGTYTYQDKQGLKLAEGMFLNNKKMGKWTWRHIDGTTDTEAEYQEGYLNGSRKVYSYFGFLQYETSYLNGKENGTETRYFPNGKIFYKQRSANDQVNGSKEYYGDNGKTVLSIFYLNDDPIYYVENYHKTNPDTIYIKNETVTINAKYENGKTAYSFQLKNGLFDGETKYYSMNGTLLYQSNSKDGLVHGKRIYYYENGKVFIEQNFENNNYQGTSSKYDEDGKLVMSIEFKDDKLHGKYIKYNKQGTPTLEVLYYNDEIVSIKK